MSRGVLRESFFFWCALADYISQIKMSDMRMNGPVGKRVRGEVTAVVDLSLGVLLTSLGRSYRYFKGETVYPFGYGNVD